MATPHICNVDCKRIEDPYISGGVMKTRVSHIMHAAEPSSAAGRYQWELNRGILDRGRRAWRESGQGQSRACRVYDEMRRVSKMNGHEYVRYGIMGRRITRELAAL